MVVVVGLVLVSGALVAPVFTASARVGFVPGIASGGTGLSGPASGNVFLVLGTLSGELCLWHSHHDGGVNSDTLVTDDVVGDWTIPDPVPATHAEQVPGCRWVCVSSGVSVLTHPLLFGEYHIRRNEVVSGEVGSGLLGCGLLRSRRRRWVSCRLLRFRIRGWRGSTHSRGWRWG